MVEPLSNPGKCPLALEKLFVFQNALVASHTSRAQWCSPSVMQVCAFARIVLAVLDIMTESQEAVTFVLNSTFFL